MNRRAVQGAQQRTLAAAAGHTAAAPSPPSDSSARLTALLSEADQLLANARQGAGGQPAAARQDLNHEDAGISLTERLVALHASESVKETRCSHLNLATNLLDRLASQEPLNRLVLHLWPGEDGHSLAVATKDGGETELARFSCHDNHILDYVNNEEIPVIISDLLEGVGVDLFYSGCVVCEVRDHRRQGSLSRHVLLRPSTQSVICDSLALTRAPGQSKWTSDERNTLESQVVLATEEPICLDPNPVVALVANKANHARLKFNTVPMRRWAARRYSQAGLSRKRKLEAAPAPPELRLHDFIKNLNAGKLKNANAKRKSNPVDALRQRQEASAAAAKQAEAVLRGAAPPPSYVTGSLNLVSPELKLSVPAQVDVNKYVRQIPKRTDSCDMTPQVVEEYVLETAERGQTRVYHTRLTILQRLANDEYIGELYVERDYKEGDKKGSTCRFLLGTRTNALRYINQFTEIFTEEGRKSVKITHRVPNQPPRITCTPAMRTNISDRAGQAVTGQAVAGQAVAGQAVTAQAVAAQPQAAILQRKPSINAQIPVSVTAAGNPAPPTATVSPGLAVKPAGGHPSTITVSAAGGVSLQLQPAKQPTVVAAQQILQSPVPSSIASKLPTTPLNPANIQVTANTEGGGNNQQEAISAIVQSLMSAGAQFEHQKKMEEQRKTVVSVVGAPTGLTTVITMSVANAPPLQMVAGSNSSAAAAAGSAQLLPTVPVPITLVSQVGNASAQKLSTSRVTLQTLLSAQQPVNQAGGGQQPPKVTMSQLAAQLSRPIASSALPSYSQALAATQQTVVQQPAAAANNLQTSPRSARRQSDQPSPGGENSVTGLQALLADTPAADKPVANPNPAIVNSNSTLLERLVSGSSGIPSQSAGSNLSQTATQLPTVPSQQAGAAAAVAAAAVAEPAVAQPANEITLAALLSNPPRSAGSSGSGSPTKMSPLLQQLQQPVQAAVTSGRLYSAAGMTSPRQSNPTPSPRPSVTSPCPAQSPRQSVTSPCAPLLPPSPRQPAGTSTLQQLMQPPAPRYPTPAANTQSILSAQLSAPPRTASSMTLQPQYQSAQVGSVMAVSSQPQLVAVTTPSVGVAAQGQQQHQAVVNVTLQDLAAGVTNSVVNSVNTANGGTVAVATAAAAQPGIVNIGGVQLVNQSIPVQLSIPGTQPITFSVSLPDGQHAVTNGQVAQQPIIVTGVSNTGKTQPVTVSSVNKLVSNGPGSVVLQGPGGNIIHLPQQPAQPSQYSIKPAPLTVSGVVRGAGQVMVRPGQASPLLVQMHPAQGVTGSQPMIVRSMPVTQQTVNCGVVQQSPGQPAKNAVAASPSPQGPATPQTPGVPPSPHSVGVTSPQAILPPDSPLVVQLQNHQDHHFMTLGNQKQQIGGQILNNQSINNQPHLKIRQQRKQSLK